MIKLYRKFYVMASAAVATIGLASCSNELNEGDLGNNIINDGISLVKTPDVVAWSGKQTLGNTLSGGLATYSTRSSEHGYSKVQDNVSVHPNAPATVTNEEWLFVKNYLAAHPNEGYTECDWTSYYIQFLGKSYDTYQAKDNNNSDHSITGSSQMDYVVIDGVHLNDYNASWGPMALCSDWPLNNPSYHESYNGLTVENKYRFYYIEYNGEMGLYLCFDYYTQGQNGNHNGDGIFNDWVLKLSPADGSEVVDPSSGDNEIGSDPEVEKPGNGDNEEGDESVVVVPVEHNHEVEVNYAILDEHKYEMGIADLVTKLSIHVRYATDVEIRIPIPTKYVIESDDLYIFNEHYTKPDGEYEGEYGGSMGGLLTENMNQEITYNVAGLYPVTLHVDFFDEEGNPYNYILVWTEGITQDVIDACWEYNKDGINFEVYNYFQTNSENKLSREELLDYMNTSTIKFLDDKPEYYINAYGYEDDWEIENTPELKPKNHEHAKVEPAEGEGYNFKYQTYHLNGTPYNDIYVHESVEEIDSAHQNNPLN